MCSWNTIYIMLIYFNNITKFDSKNNNLIKFNNIIPVIKIQRFLLNNTCIYLKSSILLDIFKIIKLHYQYQFKILISVSGSDFINNKHRFIVSYEFLSVKFNTRFQVKITVNELIPINSIKNIYITGIWWEDEIWDMFGIIFLKRKNTVRLLTDYGFYGFPLKKDFPISGFVDLKYNLVTNKPFYNDIELAQNCRIFDYNSPWNN